MEKEYKLYSDEVFKTWAEDLFSNLNNTRKEFKLYTGTEGKRAYDNAMLDYLFGENWVRAYNSDDDSKIYSEEEINTKINKLSLDKDTIWGMLKSNDDEIKRLVSEILKL